MLPPKVLAREEVSGDDDGDRDDCDDFHYDDDDDFLNDDDDYCRWETHYGKLSGIFFPQ